jgi:CYTH domain-containing protein
MPIEHEHKYLIQSLPNAIKPISTVYYEQFYFAYDTTRQLVQRCRKKTTSAREICVMTHKMGSGERVLEVEHEINKEVYEELKVNCQIGHLIEKYRREFRIDGLLWEVDSFSEGLFIAELENPPLHYRVPVEHFGKIIDVSGKFEYSNYFMSMNGVKKVKFD